MTTNRDAAIAAADNYLAPYGVPLETVHRAIAAYEQERAKDEAVVGSLKRLEKAFEDAEGISGGIGISYGGAIDELDSIAHRILEKLSRPSPAADVKALGWDHRYRRLDKGEIIRAMDECQQDDGSWRADGGQCAGLEAPDPAYTSHRVYRRLHATDVKALREARMALHHVRTTGLNDVAGFIRGNSDAQARINATLDIVDGGLAAIDTALATAGGGE